MTIKREPTLFESFIPVIFLILLLTINVGIFGDEALGGSNQIVLILSAAVAAIIAIRLGYRWSQLQDGIVRSIGSAMSSMLILLLIGSLAGTWMLSGVVPAMIYYGLQILSPRIFLFAACIVASIVSLATGSSWTTSATVGIALIGIGRALGIYDGLIAGAILSGAYFGDKMSPLSDTTNLAPAMAGTDLFTHIRYMAYTTIPSITISLIIFLIIGFTQDLTLVSTNTANILTAISDRYYISGILFIVPVVVIIMIVRKVPAIPALLAGTLLGSLFALLFQPHLVLEVSQQSAYNGKLFDFFYSNFPVFTQMFMGTIQSLFGDISITTDNAMVTGLLSAGGMKGMLGTIWLILSAMIFGGVMEKAGFLKRIAKTIISFVNSTGSLVGSTVGTCVFFNITASDQYLAIVVPGRMYSEIYKEKGLAPQNLSRSLEDSGTVTSVLIPWNTCGAYHASVLGVSTLVYAPFAFFNIISPFMSIFYAYAGIRIKKLVSKEEEN